MADSTNKILCIVLILVMISQGYSQCSLRDISISQKATGQRFQGKPEWSVTIKNNCKCDQKNVVLNCNGFQTIEPVNPEILTVSNKSGPSRFCLVKAGQPINQEVITFKYAWDVSFPLKLISSISSCS